MYKITEEYLKTNYLGSHCASTSIRNILAYHGHMFTEDLCFGLGAGLGFSIFKLPEMPYYSFSGRARNIEHLLCRSLGFYPDCYYNLDNEEMWYIFESIIKSGEPLLVKLDINNLEYLKQFMKINERIQLGEHMAVLIGVDEKYAVLSEYFKRLPFTIEKKKLIKSMNTKFEEKSLYNIFYRFHFPNKLIELPLALINSIYYNSHEMINGFGSSLGLPGLIKFMNEIFMWPDIMSQSDLKRNAYMAWASFEKIGTGGGNFRLMYARFLNQAGDELNSSYLKKVANEYADLARYWKMFSLGMYETFLAKDNKKSDMEERLQKLSSYIKTKEKENIVKLNEWALKYSADDIDLSLTKAN